MLKKYEGVKAKVEYILLLTERHYDYDDSAEIQKYLIL